MLKVDSELSSAPPRKKRLHRPPSNRKSIRQLHLLQLREFLDIYTQNYKPLPRNNRGTVALIPILRAANLPIRFSYLYPEFREEIEKYVDKVGLCQAQDFQPPPLASKAQVRAPAKVMTYGELLELSLPIADRSMAQYQSALIRFAAVQGKSTKDCIGSELGGGFDEAVLRFIGVQYSGDANSARSAVSCIRKWQGEYTALQRIHNLPQTLQGAVKQLVEEDGRPAKVISKAVGHCNIFITNLMLGNQKTVPRSTLALLEEVLNVPANTLISLAPPYNPRRRPSFCPTSQFPTELRGDEQSIRLKRSKIKKQLPDNFPDLSPNDQYRLLESAVHYITSGLHLSDYGRRLGENIQMPYRLKLPLPERLQAEFNSISIMKRSKGAVNKPNRALRWSKGGNERWNDMMYTFLGYCLLPNTATDERMRGPGLSLDSLTVGLIVSPALIDSYLEFRRARTAGMDSTNSEVTLTYLISMLRPGSGWVVEHPELLERLPESVRLQIEEAGGWDKQCAQQHSYLTELVDNSDFEVSRDAFGPIMPMIEMGRPLDLLQQALYRQREELAAIADLTNITPLEKAEMWRDHLLVSLLSWLPLRAKHWPDMTYIAAHRSLYGIRNGSQLRHINGDCWGLYLEAKDFKNVKNKAIFGPKGDRDVKLLFHEMRGMSTVEPLLDMYMRIHRPLLCPGDGPVFPDVLGTPLPAWKVYQIVKKWTHKYLSEHGSTLYGLRLKGVSAFGPHAFRHLMASHIVINSGSFESAAHMLLDSPSMVQKHYGIFSPEHRLVNTMRHLDIWTGDT